MVRVKRSLRSFDHSHMMAALPIATQLADSYERRCQIWYVQQGCGYVPGYVPELIPQAVMVGHTLLMPNGVYGISSLSFSPEYPTFPGPVSNIVSILYLY